MVSMKTGLGESVRQAAKLSPTVIQGIEMLSLPVAELASYVLKVSEDNPFLEVDFSHELFACDRFDRLSLKMDFACRLQLRAI